MREVSWWGASGRLFNDASACSSQLLIVTSTCCCLAQGDQCLGQLACCCPNSTRRLQGTLPSTGNWQLELAGIKPRVDCTARSEDGSTPDFTTRCVVTFSCPAQQLDRSASQRTTCRPSLHLWNRLLTDSFARSTAPRRVLHQSKSTASCLLAKQAGALAQRPHCKQMQQGAVDTGLTCGLSAGPVSFHAVDMPIMQAQPVLFSTLMPPEQPLLHYCLIR